MQTAYFKDISLEDCKKIIEIYSGLGLVKSCEYFHFPGMPFVREWRVLINFCGEFDGMTWDIYLK